MRRIVIFLMCFATFVAFSQKVVITETMCYEPDYTAEQFDKFKANVVSNGDKESYDALLNLLPSYERLPYSIIMAKKYGDRLANYMIYVELTDIYKSADMRMDSMTFRYAIENLKMAADSGFLFANGEMARIYLYGENVQQDTVKAKGYYMETLRISNWNEKTRERQWRKYVENYNRKVNGSE